MMAAMYRNFVPLLVLAALGTACYEPGDHSPTAPEVQGALMVSVSAESIPADGVSTLVVTGQIDPGATEANRTLVFTVNDGVLLEATADPFRSVERKVDSSGRAAVTLRSSRNVRPVEIAVAVMAKPSVVARTTVSFTEADAQETISFVSIPPSAPADTETRSAVTVQVAPSLPSGKRSVSFATSRGTFAQSGNMTYSIPAGSDHRARVDLVSPATPGVARITATVDGVTAEAFLDFVAALPESITVSSSKVRLEATNSESGTTPVRVDLRRAIGQVSPTLVSPRVVARDTGAELPVLIRDVVPTNAMGTTTFTLTVGALAFRGQAEILVEVPNVATVGRALIEIVAPPATAPGG